MSQRPPNILDEIVQRNSSTSDAIAVVCREESVTYQELFDRADNLAAALLPPRPDSGPRLRIALQCPDGIDHIVGALAILRAQACLVPIPTQLTQPEVDEILTTTAPHGILRFDSDQDDPNYQPTPGLVPPFPNAELEALNPCFIRFSSGTTGVSKGVVITHEGLRDRVSNANTGLQIGPSDNILWVLPMAHHFAVSIMLYLYHGATTIVEPSPLPEQIYATALQGRATVSYASPFHYRGLSGFEGGGPLPDLRLAIVTAAAMDETLSAEFRERFGIPLTGALGVIEVGLPIINLDDAATNPMALGKALPDYDIAIVDETLEPVAEGEIGELMIRGSGMLAAYLDPWDPAPGCFAEGGYFRSGDLASIDRNGTIQLRGRLKSVVNVGGMKVFPEEIEQAINTHPLVTISRVSGATHPTLGSFPVAEIVTTEPVKPVALMKWCKERLASYKIPMRFTVVDSIPMTQSGKIQRG